MYLTCFGVGLALAVLTFVGGLGHLPWGDPRTGHAQQGAKAVQPHSPAGQMSPLNGFSIVAFLCWFGGTGYLLHHANIFRATLVLFFSTVSGVAGASLVFGFSPRS